MSDAQSTSAQHPRGLYVLFSAEAWERFSYYGMRALLVLYLTSHLEMDREKALFIYAMYTGLVYLTPMFGGLIADRILGARKAIIIGGSIMALGHLAMAVESLLYPALGLLIVGNGFFKPNISTIVGGLYEENDPRRDGGFTIFYMGINLGAFFSPLICGTLGENYGWHYGFSAAGVGMVIGLAVFLAYQRLLGSAGYPPEMGSPAPGTSLRARDWRDIGLYTAGSVALVFACVYGWVFVQPVWQAIPGFVKLIVGTILVVGALGSVLKTASSEGREELERTGVIFILAFFVIFFWMGFEQAGGTMTLFADEQTDRSFMDWEVPASWFQSINPLAIMLLAPILSRFWYKKDNGPNPITVTAKMAWGMIILGLGFVVMYIAQNIAESRNVGEQLGQVSFVWLFSVYFIHTVGELCLSPIGLSMVTKLTIPRLASLMMGVWFCATAIANYLAGVLEGLLHTYDIPLYGFLVASSIGAGIILLLLNKKLTQMSHGRA